MSLENMTLVNDNLFIHTFISDGCTSLYLPRFDTKSILDLYNLKIVGFKNICC